MSDWRACLTKEEADRLNEIDRLRDDLTAERRKIWDRCRKRMERKP